MLKKMMTIVTMKKNYKETIINYAKRSVRIRRWP